MAKRSMYAISILALAMMIMTGCQATMQTAAPAPAEKAIAAPAPKPTDAKVCTNCHKPEAGNLRGNFENVAFKSQSIQLKIDNDTMVLKFDPDALKVVIADKTLDSEGLREIKKGHEIRIAYTEKNGVKTASLVSSKPPIKLSADKLLTTAEVEKLVAEGPEKGKYLLIDARPAPRFMEGAIPTAINIPFVAFDKMVGKLPQDKNIQLIYYCGGVT
jgi:hypothetical protein